MGNQYYGRSWNELMELCTAEYRFYRNSQRNFRPANIGAGTGVADMGEYLIDADNVPKQSVCLGMPAFCVDYPTAHFNFPQNFDDTMGAEDAFTLEYLGVVQDRLIPDRYMALVGEDGAATPYVGIRDDNLVEMDFGTQQVSNGLCEWWKDGLIHFVVSRAAGAAPETEIYINGVRIDFVSRLAGAGAFTDAAGQIFNHADNNGDQHPWWGHHFMLRQYSAALRKSEVIEMFQDAQRLIPHHLMHIPVDSAE